MRHSLPFVMPGQSVGLMGGSFDPAHDGHLHISREALKRLNLDWLWWLVSPGNPLKPLGPADMAQRIAAAEALVDHPRIKITDVERQIGTRYTGAAIEHLQALYPGVRFVWLMGADNLAQFHRWQRWDWIMQNVPVGVIARPGSTETALTSRAARQFREHRISPSDATGLASHTAPAWTYLPVPMVATSSSQIRAAGKWPKTQTS